MKPAILNTPSSFEYHITNRAVARTASNAWNVQIGLYSSANQNVNLYEDLGAINPLTQYEPSGGLLLSLSRRDSSWLLR